ncbi:beta-glucosidase 11-like isoform X3 [Diospyros lotus]|uniref:beta-glucosidase 11-like isoform X3 n=1 Tax=Diospyros lotus TaxID=55363 RepID=UPI00224E1991|nr:beta-glucosidase 11-like isoform X3 [Diospyros lotus]
MANVNLSFLFSILLLNFVAIVFGADKFSRSDFPADFVFGSGTSAYQYEGAAFEDGRTPSIWDTSAHAGNMGGATGDVTCDGYHKYKEDVKLMVEIGLEAYRFSISWTRLIPSGRGPVNPKGLEYYNNLINELVKNGIQPYATLTHSDIPQSLEDEYEGWFSRKIVRDFTAYANVCFREFGDRVLHWTTVNEPNVFAMGGYDDGWTPPQRCSPPFGMTNCSRGDSSTEPYVAAHNILLAHASAARLYRKKYQGKILFLIQERQHGYIGINIYSSQLVPYTNATKDLIATERARSFLFGWIVEPLLFGDYPEIMKMIAGTRIPAFTKSESKQVKGSIDFLGLNHYFTLYVKDRSSSLEKNNRDYHADMAAQTIYVQGDTPSDEYPITPSGLAGTLEYYKQFYGNLPIYIHENGQKTRRNSTLNDTARVEYLHVFIGSVLDALRNGSNVRGYFQWSFMDLYELLDGYRVSFGLYYVDLDDKDLKRHPKLSSHWYSNFLKGKISSLDAIVDVKKNISSLSQPQLISDA